MQRAPLRELVPTDIMSGENRTKLTPDKTRDWAAAAAAAKLLGSAKKSQTKQLAKRMKLSLKKTCVGSGVKNASARTLALSVDSDLNDTVEFKDSVLMKAAAKLSLATRKRKNPIPAERAEETKYGQRENEEVRVCDVAQTCGNLAKQSTKNSSARDAICETWHMTETAELDADPLRPASSCEGEGMESPCEKKDLSASLHTCPACGQTLPHGRFVQHMQLCLKQQFGCEKNAHANMRKDEEETGTTDAERSENQQTETSAEEAALPTEYVFCQLCQKDLSHLNSHRRMLHINNCIDQEEKKRKEAEEKLRALEAAKLQVLGCPMCGKGLRTAAGRKSHLKKCASSLGVQADQLLAAVKRQEEEHQATLAAGILPDSYRPGRSTRQTASSTHRGLASLPKSKLDEDTQLALAISSSLQGDLAEAGPSTTTNSTAPNRRGRKNKQEGDYLLLKLTQAQAAGRVESRVSDLIMQQEEEEEEENIPSLPAVAREHLGGRMKTVHWSADEESRHSKMLWRMASLEEQSSGNTEMNNLDAPLQFYVCSLMPPVEVNTVAAGSRTRRMSDIPGRRRSLDAGTTVETLETSEQEDDGGVAEDMPPPSTQTAALLADLAAEADGLDSTMQLPSSQPLAGLQRQTQQDLLLAFTSLVNRQEFSDVVIHAAGAATLHAHRIILSVRCPALLKLSEEGCGEVDLSDCSPHCVLALLKFLYAGVAEVDQRWVPGTRQLALRLGLTTFAEICGHQRPEPGSPDLTSGDTENGEEDPMNTTGSTSVTIVSESESGDMEEDKRGSVAESAGVCGGQEQNGAVAGCTDPVPPEQLAGLDHVQKSVSDSEQHSIRRQQPESQVGLPGLETRWRNSASQKDSRRTGEDKGFHGEQVITHSQEATASQRRSRTDLPEVGNDSNDSKTGNSSFANLEDKFVLSEFEKELREKVKVACDMVDEDMDIAMEKQCVSPFCTKTIGSSPSTRRTTLDKELLRRASLDDDIQLVDVLRQCDAKDHGCATADAGRTAKEKPPQPFESVMKTPEQNPEPMDTIEISDDDLFSGDEIDVSLLPSTPRHGGQKNSTAEGEVYGLGWKTDTKQMVESGAGLSSSTVGGENIAASRASFRSTLSVEHQRERDQHERHSMEEVESGEKEKTERYRLTSASGGGGSGGDPTIMQQRLQEAVLEDNLTSFSASAVEPSSRLSLSSSPHVQHFKTSTPQLSTGGEQTHQNGGKRKAAADRNLYESNRGVLSDATATSNTETAMAEIMALQSGDLTRTSGSSPPEIGSSSMNVEQTPCVSVVEQDSLYITPAVEQSKIRRTFQLVTPLSQRQGASSVSAETPASRYAARETSRTQTLPSWGGDQSGCEEDKRRSGQGDCGDGSRQRQADPGLKALPSDNRRESGDLFGGEIDCDSDLEIIDSSLQEPPSPKFSISSKLDSSQSQQEMQPASQTLPHHLPENQPDSPVSVTSQSTRKPDDQSKSAIPFVRQTGAISAVQQTGSSVHHFSQRNDDSPAKPKGKSPAKGSPVGCFSQRSADSDKELLRMVEQVSRQVTMESVDPLQSGSSPTSRGSVAEQLCDAELMEGGSPVEEDVWEGFDNVDVYNPDLDCFGHDRATSLATSDIGLDSSKVKISPCSSSHSEKVSSDQPKSVVRPPSTHSPDRSSTPQLKKPLKLRAKDDRKSPNNSPKKSLVASHASAAPAERQPLSSKQSTSGMFHSELYSVPIRFRSSSPSQALAKAGGGGFEDRSPAARDQLLHQEGQQPPEGFFVEGGDCEAANSSFLWSEENAPVDERRAPEDGGLWEGEAALELGREETVLSQDAEAPVTLTPTVARQTKKRQRGKSTWIPPSPFTPMPAYDSMATPDLKHEVQKYGLKPVGKKRMKLALKDIYMKTHQYETDSDCDVDSMDLPSLGPGPIPNKEADQSRGKPGTSQNPPILNKHSEWPGAQQPTGPACSPLSHKQSDQRRLKATGWRIQPSVPRRRLESGQRAGDQHLAGQRETDQQVQPGQKKGSKPKRGLTGEMKGPDAAQSTRGRQPASNKTTAPKTGGTLRSHPSHQSPTRRRGEDGGKQKRDHTTSPVKSASDYSSSPEKGSLSSSQGSSTSDQPDVSVFEEREMDSDDEDDVTPSQQSAAQDLPQKLMQFVQSHPGLYHKVLTYEPLDLAVLKEDLKVAGIRCSQEKLLNFLDEKCITFTSKNMIPRSRQNRGRRPRARKLAVSQK